MVSAVAGRALCPGGRQSGPCRRADCGFPLPREGAGGRRAWRASLSQSVTRVEVRPASLPVTDVGTAWGWKGGERDGPAGWGGRGLREPRPLRGGQRRWRAGPERQDLPPTPTPGQKPPSRVERGHVFLEPQARVAARPPFAAVGTSVGEETLFFRVAWWPGIPACRRPTWCSEQGPGG